MGDEVQDVELHPGEVIPLQANFEDVLATGEEVVDAIASGYDSNGVTAPLGLFSDAPFIVSPRVQQRVQIGSGVVLGESYLVVLTATTSAGLDYVQRFQVITSPLVEAVPPLIISVFGRDANNNVILVFGPSSNSYVVLSEAEVYMASRLRTDAWDRASRRDRVKALLMASLDLDQVQYKNRKWGWGFDAATPTSPAQALAFPRTYTLDGNATPYVPQEVKDAQCEQALFLLTAGPGFERRLRLQAQGVASFSVEGASETYRTTGNASHPWYRLCPEAQRLIARHVDWQPAVGRGAGMVEYGSRIVGRGL